VIAFFFTAQLSATTIFDNVSYQLPKISSTPETRCQSNDSSVSLADKFYSGDKDICLSLVKSVTSYKPSSQYGYPSTWTVKSCFYKGTTYDMDYINCTGDYYRWVQNSNKTGDGQYEAVDLTLQSVARGGMQRFVNTTSCPPDLFPNYIFERDTNNDGKTDQCYNPDELDNASNCANQVGSMLPALTNLATRVCKTDSETGASCGYSKKDGDPSYKLDLEMNCFGDGEKVPEYDPEPMPQPETCAKVNDQLMVCKEKPEEKCDAMGNCQDQCGFVNKEFYCFIPCSGEDCDKPTPPVNCETNPTAPVCVEEPEPEDPDFCKNNPTDPKCTHLQTVAVMVVTLEAVALIST